METNLRQVAQTSAKATDSIGRHWRGYLIGCIALGLVGCQSLKEAGVIGTGAAVGAGAATVLSGGVIAPMAGAAVGASVTDVVVSLTDEPKERIVEEIVERTSFFTLLEKIIEVAGWWLMLVIVGPILIGWMMPSPVYFKKPNGNGHE